MIRKAFGLFGVIGMTAFFACSVTDPDPSETNGKRTEAATTGPLPLRAGRPKAWEDAGLYDAAGEYGVSPSGNLQNRLDLFAWSTPTLGDPIAVSLIHDSADAPVQRGVGFGFRLAVAASLSIDASGNVVITLPDGTPIAFTLLANGSYRAEVYELTTLSKNGTTYTWSGQGGWSRVFTAPNGAAWLETSRIDRTGAATAFHFDASDRLVSITDSAGRAATFTWSAGFCTSAVDPEGRAYTLSYAAGELASVQAPAVGGVTPTATFAYDPASTHVIVSRTQWSGDTIGVFSYAGYQVATAKTQTGFITRFDYYPGQTNVSDSAGRRVSLRYAGGALVEVVDEHGLSTRVSRDASGRLVQAIDPLGRVRRFAYDASDNVVGTTDELGRTTASTYDARHNATSVKDVYSQTRTYAYNAFDEVASETNPIGETTTYGYDAAGNLVSIVDFAGKTRLTATYANGRLTSVAGADGKTTTLGHDAYGNVTSLALPSGRAIARTTTMLGAALTVSDPLESVSIAYDAWGRPTQATRAAGGDVFVGSDLAGRLVHVDNQLGGPGPMDTTYSANGLQATRTANGVPLQTAPATLASFAVPPPAACTPTCSARCGGTLSDGCGGTLACTTCPASMGCNAAGFCEIGATGAPDGSAPDAGASDGGGADACVPRKCGAHCGSIDDNCGGTLVCDECAAGYVCEKNHICKKVGKGKGGP